MANDEWRMPNKGDTKSYKELAGWLRASDIGSYMQRHDQMVVSNANPAMPTGNCFWVTLKDKEWYLGTFLPAIYLIPSDQSVGAVCEAVFRSSGTTIYTIRQNLIDRYNLQRLTEDQADALLGES
jgi:hypothetical protein